MQRFVRALFHVGNSRPRRKARVHSLANVMLLTQNPRLG
jgi:hypothetical protein